MPANIWTLPGGSDQTADRTSGRTSPRSRPFAEAGFDEIYLSPIGLRDDCSGIAGFFDFCRDEVLPTLQAT